MTGSAEITLAGILVTDPELHFTSRSGQFYRGG
jgi:hypothetical protein